MYRITVCLLFITIFQNGIKTSLQDDPTTPAPETKGNSSEKKVDDSKTENNVTSSNLEDQSGQITLNNSQESKTAASTTALPNLDALPIPDVTSKLLGPVKQVRERIGEAVTKTFDSAKGIADGAFNFLRGAVKGLF